MIAQKSSRLGLLGKLAVLFAGVVSIGTFAPSAEAGHHHHRHYCRHHGWTQNPHRHLHNYVPTYQVAPVLQPNFGGPAYYGSGLPY